jgi:hypothetical protein
LAGILPGKRKEGRKEVEKCEKLLKTGRQNVLGREFVEIGHHPKKGSNILTAPPFEISKYATDS